MPGRLPCASGGLERGELTPDRLAADARAAGLDFLAATEHNTAETHDAWLREADDARW